MLTKAPRVKGKNDNETFWVGKIVDTLREIDSNAKKGIGSWSGLEVLNNT